MFRETVWPRWLARFGAFGVFGVLGFSALLSACAGEPREAAPVTEPASLDELAGLTAEEGPALWYDSSPEDQGRAVTEAFNRRYPSASVRHVRLVGGLDIAARMVLEARSPGEASDVATLAAEQAHGLQSRDLLSNVPWARYGVDESMIAAPFAVATAAAVYVVLFNTDLLTKEEAPSSWDDFLGARWAGRLGAWVSPHPLVQMVPAWGADRTTNYAAAFAAQEPILYRSTFPLAQAVASGELPAALGIWHAARPAIEAGAPLSTALLDPTPVSTLYTVVPANAPRPYTARLFAAWLASDEGALAYEEATGRGNPGTPATETARLLQGRATSEFPFSEAAEAGEWMERLGATLRAGAEQTATEPSASGGG
ncbi:MAG: ABC transporter substrate-binding protein [Longimicrobiales bacterium]